MWKNLIAIAAVASMFCLAPAVAAKTAKKTASKKGRSRRGAKSSAQSWRTRQQAPSPERYREIQEALAAKGYLRSPATGSWNQDSADALRRFQQDQHLDATGKLNSRSLIALGLGPKTESPAEIKP